jgi:hypothetical protein
MKHTIFICFIFIYCAVNAQDKKMTWDYPIKPGMEEWRKFKSMAEMYRACQVPESVLKQLDTETLTDICLNFPAYGVLFFHNTPQQGFDSYYSRFNGIRELLSRKDAGTYLLKKYLAASFNHDFNRLWTTVDQGRYVFKMQYFETIMAQQSVINSMTVEERQLLLKEALDKFDTKAANRDLFGGQTFAVNAWILAQVLDKDSKLPSSRTMAEFLKSGFLANLDLEDIYKQAKLYDHE